MVDYSIRVDHLDRNGILEQLEGSLVDVSQDTGRLRKTLAKKLKTNHPIHKTVSSLANAELNKILVNLALPEQKHRQRKMKAIVDYFFRQYPDAPATNFKRVMEEDAYFAKLTSGIIY